ncbi:hypothetical protein MCOR25_002305 [Pyricularia grisea]|uniref:Uncharacterized protein n=1 Tax=Pyricularia grisea TaxID=148305 RepID=A0A6P8AT03_PYRGI|nr:uncharacterized protein PgNI_09766 [Pyricularia grisea]KAI6378059.1 hypothetical protein MCOR25_002305 [Pyricularia grisea]TLD05256.1 hypothetical protein PgNI_09766 [Pyricularia grisea]
MSKAATDIARRPVISHRRAASCYEHMRVRSLYDAYDQLWTEGRSEPSTTKHCQENYQLPSKPLKAPQVTDVPCPRTLLRNSRGDNLQLTEEMMSAYNILRGPQPVSRKDPLLNQMQADVGLFSLNGSEVSSGSGSTLASSSGFSRFMHNVSSPFHTTIITPPDDADDLYSNLSDRTITCNIRRSPEKRAVLHQPFIETKGHEMKAEVVKDPWKCGPIDTSRYKLPPAASEYEARNDTDCKVDLPPSMISPETFLAWSEGAQLWDTDILHRESRSREPDKPVRMRPSTPPQSPERDGDNDGTVPRSFHEYEEQYDQEDGDRMSPHYKVPLNPSILWESRPVTPEMMYHYFPHGEFDRMDPAAGQACRDASLGFIPDFGVEGVLPIDGEMFSEYEIDQVLNTHRGPIFDDITAAKYKEAISTLEEHLAFSEQQETELEQQNEVQRQLLRSLEVDLASLQPTSSGGGSGSGSPAASETETCYSPVSAQRRARILQHMATRLRENMWQHHCRREAIAAARRENALLRLQVGQARERLRAASAQKSALWADQVQRRAPTPARQDSQ